MPIPPDLAAVPSHPLRARTSVRHLYRKVADKVTPDGRTIYIIPIGGGEFGEWHVPAHRADAAMDAEIEAYLERLQAEQRLIAL